MIKNCINCKYLEWVDNGGNEYSSSEGFVCTNRLYRCDAEESNHLGQLEKDSYLEKGKSCCELKTA